MISMKLNPSWVGEVLGKDANIRFVGKPAMVNNAARLPGSIPEHCATPRWKRRLCWCEKIERMDYKRDWARTASLGKQGLIPAPEEKINLHPTLNITVGQNVIGATVLYVQETPGGPLSLSWDKKDDVALRTPCLKRKRGKATTKSPDSLDQITPGERRRYQS